MELEQLPSVYLWVYGDMCVHESAHVYANVCICNLSEKKKFFPCRTFLSWLLSYHHLWAWKMPTYFNNISHTFVGRQSLLWKEIMWRISKPKIKNFQIICCFEWSGPSPPHPFIDGWDLALLSASCCLGLLWTLLVHSRWSQFWGLKGLIQECGWYPLPQLSQCPPP